MKRICEELNIDTKKFDPRQLLSAISNAKNAMLTPDEYEKRYQDPFRKMVGRTYRVYQREL